LTCLASPKWGDEFAEVGTLADETTNQDEDALALGQAISVLGKTLLDGILAYAEQNNIKLEGLPEDPKVDIAPDQISTVLRSALAMSFPLLAPSRANQRPLLPTSPTHVASAPDQAPEPRDLPAS
jgi:hypothetical protein